MNRTSAPGRSQARRSGHRWALGSFLPAVHDSSSSTSIFTPPHLPSSSSPSVHLLHISICLTSIICCSPEVEQKLESSLESSPRPASAAIKRHRPFHCFPTFEPSTNTTSLHTPS